MEEDAPHLIFTPERSLDLQEFITDVSKVYQNYGRCVVVIGETVKDRQGNPLGAQGKPYFIDSFGHRYFHGPANFLATLVMKELGLTTRFDKPGTLQRMSMLCASEIDLAEAWEVGAQAMRQALAGNSGKMVTLLRETGPAGEYCFKMGETTLERVANIERKMPPEYLNEAGNFVTSQFLDYLRPLVGQLPEPYLRLNRTSKINPVAYT